MPFETLFRVNPKTRWAITVVAFLSIAVFDFSTPPEYVPAYLYTLPILISVSFLRPRLAKTLLALAMAATLLNLVFPKPVAYIPSVLFNRLLAALSILISAFFMLRYIRYQTHFQAQERLLETERNLAKVREDLIATLTHDLKTPLLGEEKTLQAFQQETFGPLSTEQKEILGALRRSNARQLALVDNLLAVYRHDNLGVDIQMTAIDLDELIADLLTELQYLATERKISFAYHCRETPPSVHGDALQIKRVLSNLIHNALNYTPSGGCIEAQLKAQSGQVAVSIQDTGSGLSPDDLEKVFHQFYRAEGNRQIIGTGLGLYLSRQIIEAHQGAIWAENTKPSGCRFTFTLPLATDPPTPKLTNVMEKLPEKSTDTKPTNGEQSL